MTRSYPYSLVSVGAFFAGTLLLTACSGTAGSPSTGASSSAAQTQAVSAGDISGPATVCGVGFAHPSVCCEAGPGKTAACVAHPGAPFTACAAGSTTYPDPRSCCPLDASGACIAPVPSPTPVPPIDPWCVYPCPAGQYAPATGAAGVCCETDATGGTVCHGGPSTGPIPATGGGVAASAGSSNPSSGGPSTGGSSSGGPSTGGSSGGSVDAGVGCGEPCVCNTLCPAGQPCPPCECPTPSPTCPPPPPPICRVCPPGWQVPQGDPLLCCTEEASGVIACFSRGVPPPPPPPDGGPICDPNGPPPRAGCSWDLKTCSWECPVCDPSGPAPNPACSWDLTTCQWDCPVCDPSGPPPRTGCQWDSKACVWLCL